RIMAQLGERLGDRGALDWRRTVAQLQPQSTEDILAWAKCALQFNDVTTAERILSQVSPNAKQAPGYHALAALIAQLHQQNDTAEAEWHEALHLAPNEKSYQLQLGILQSRATDAGRRASGIAILTGLREDAAQRAAATRALIADGLS